ncbi:hypothetical protein VTO42DRAFT_5902 [Malbranchea cinnamomea]
MPSGGWNTAIRIKIPTMPIFVARMGVRSPIGSSTGRLGTRLGVRGKSSRARRKTMRRKRTNGAKPSNSWTLRSSSSSAAKTATATGTATCSKNASATSTCIPSTSTSPIPSTSPTPSPRSPPSVPSR